MFENLTERFERAFKVLKGHGQITEINVAETLKEVRRALLEADVSFNTAKAFTNKVKERALGQNVLNSISPSQLLEKKQKELKYLKTIAENPQNVNSIPNIYSQINEHENELKTLEEQADKLEYLINLYYILIYSSFLTAGFLALLILNKLY